MNTVRTALIVAGSTSAILFWCWGLHAMVTAACNRNEDVPFYKAISFTNILLSPNSYNDVGKNARCVCMRMFSIFILVVGATVITVVLLDSFD